MVGFARYNDSHGLSTTDNTWQANGGATKWLSPRWDAVLDYSYAQYGVNNGEYNPKTISIGAVYHFVKPKVPGSRLWVLRLPVDLPRLPSQEPRTQRRTDDPQPRTDNPQPRTDNPQPRTDNPQPRTDNPEPFRDL